MTNTASLPTRGQQVQISRIYFFWCYFQSNPSHAWKLYLHLFIIAPNYICNLCEDRSFFTLTTRRKNETTLYWPRVRKKVHLIFLVVLGDLTCPRPHVDLRFRPRNVRSLTSQITSAKTREKVLLYGYLVYSYDLFRLCQSFSVSTFVL